MLPEVVSGFLLLTTYLPVGGMQEKFLCTNILETILNWNLGKVEHKAELKSGAQKQQNRGKTNS